MTAIRPTPERPRQSDKTTIPDGRTEQAEIRQRLLQRLAIALCLIAAVGAAIVLLNRLDGEPKLDVAQTNINPVVADTPAPTSIGESSAATAVPAATQVAALPATPAATQVPTATLPPVVIEPPTAASAAPQPPAAQATAASNAAKAPPKTAAPATTAANTSSANGNLTPAAAAAQAAARHAHPDGRHGVADEPDGEAGAPAAATLPVMPPAAAVEARRAQATPQSAPTLPIAHTQVPKAAAPVLSLSSPERLPLVATPPPAERAITALAAGVLPVGAHGYTVQAGVFQSSNNADKLINKLTAAGIPARVETRVQIGPFRSKEEAETIMHRLRELGVTPLLQNTSQ